MDVVKHLLLYLSLKSILEQLIIYLEERFQMSDTLSFYFLLIYKICPIEIWQFQSVLQIEMLSVKFIHIFIQK